jgi:hypothetical protein
MGTRELLFYPLSMGARDSLFQSLSLEGEGRVRVVRTEG